MDCYRYLLLEIRTVVNFSGYSIDLLMLVTDLTQCCVVLATKPRSVPILNLLLLNFFKPFQLSFGTRTDLKINYKTTHFQIFVTTISVQHVELLLRSIFCHGVAL